MKHKTFIFSLLALCALLMNGPAFAQQSQQNNNSDQFNFGFGQQPQDPQVEKPKAFNPYDRKYRPRPELQTSGRRPLVGEADLAPEIIRTPGNREGDFALRLVAGKTVTGCLKKENQSLSITKDNGTMTIKMTGGQISTDQKNVQYSQYQCDVKKGVSATDIPLNREELIAEEIKIITVQSENTSSLFRLKLDITPERIIFTEDKGLGAVKRPSAADTIFEQTFWFFPPGTKILHSNAKDTAGTRDAMIRTLARSKGLTPLEELLPDFTAPASAHGKIYVVDEKGLFKNDTNEPVLLGEIEQTEPFFGPEGPYERLIKKQVTLENPGLYD